MSADGEADELNESGGESPTSANKDTKDGSSYWIFPRNRLPQFVPTKTFALKRADGEPLTREDLQYDLLEAIFNDDTKAFSNPAGGDTARMTFSEVYYAAIASSTRCTRVTRDKMSDNPSFARAFAMMALLVNVGRVNTTLAFYPEMRTALRTYHPVPALHLAGAQGSSLQDAPRIKGVLRGCFLPGERTPPATPAEMLAALTVGEIPTTSIVHAIFVLSAHSNAVSRQHFPTPLELTDLFRPYNIPSSARARAFLWLVYEYVEGHTVANPFASPEWTQAHPSQAPELPRIGPEEMARENVDPPEEIAMGQKLVRERAAFLRQQEEDPQPPTKRSKRTKEAASAEDSPPKRRRADSEVDLSPPVENGTRHIPPHTVRMRASPQRSMFEQACYFIATRDALDDSDDEHGDPHVQLDYQRRLAVLRKIRERATTPEAVPHYRNQRQLFASMLTTSPA